MKFRDLSRKLRAPFNRKNALNKLKQFYSNKRSIHEIVDNAIDFKSKGLYRIASVQIREEILSLAQAVRSINSKTMLEFGTCNGGTYFIWTNLASELAITCDINKSKIRDELYHSLPPPDSNCKVIPLTADTHDAGFLETVKKSLNGKRLIFCLLTKTTLKNASNLTTTCIAH